MGIAGSADGPGGIGVQDEGTDIGVFGPVAVRERVFSQAAVCLVYMVSAQATAVLAFMASVGISDLGAEGAGVIGQGGNPMGDGVQGTGSGGSGIVGFSPQTAHWGSGTTAGSFFGEPPA